MPALFLIINQQPPEKRDNESGDYLDVVDTFFTIQGEGPFAGTPAVFVRLAGCSILCPACDTDYTTNRVKVPIRTLVKQIYDAQPYPKQNRLVVITGGEPFRQRCGRFVNDLVASGLQVQFETNGTLYDESMGLLWDTVSIVCSPKTGKLNEKLMPHIGSLKYILQAGKVDPDDGLPTDSLMTGVRPCRPWEGFKGTVYVQPLDEGPDAFERNQANQKAAVESCMRYNRLLCLQTHKILGLA